MFLDQLSKRCNQFRPLYMSTIHNIQLLILIKTSTYIYSALLRNVSKIAIWGLREIRKDVLWILYSFISMAVPWGLGMCLQRTRICWVPSTPLSSICPMLSSDYSHKESIPTITSSDKVSTDSRSASLLDPSMYCQAFWNLISAPFKPLASTFMTGASSPGSGFLLQSHPTCRFCSLRCSYRWSFNTHTHTHTHPYSFLILRFYVRTMVTAATLVVSLRIFFLKDWCFVLFFHLRKYWPQKAKSLWQEKCS